MNKRPWGNYQVLYDGNDCKVKRITVNPKQRLSYQLHKQRSEVWVIVSGKGKIIINDEPREINPESIITIPVGAKHRIENNNKYQCLIFIEVQTGKSFREEDITRYSDDYGREEKGENK